MGTISIREIVDSVSRGQIRIPAFQRGFVWEPNRVAYLMDSLYKRYPVGSLLFWRTREKLKVERDLGPFTLPEPKADYPIEYVLDGQQRLTSIFGVFQRDLTRNDTVDWQEIYFDLSAKESPQDQQFLALASSEVDPTIHFPLNTLYDSKAYRQATEPFDKDLIEKIDRMQESFKELQIPVELSQTEDKTTVAIIFERVNRQGVPLDTLQLLSAWTWSEDFQLQEQFAELAAELQPFGFADIGEDTNLVLRCCSAILTGDASPEKLLSLNGERVREHFTSVANGLKLSIDYLKKQLRVASVANLPFATMLVPLTVFFSVPGNQEHSFTADQNTALKRWFWRTAFSRRYSSAVLRNLNTDIREIGKLRRGEANQFGEFPVGLNTSFFKDNQFTFGNVNTKTFILLLAQMSPKSFISGAFIDLESTLKQSNRTEFHHLMPQAFLKKSKQSGKLDSALANLAFLSRADNRQLGGGAPSEYRAKMPADVQTILESAVCPTSVFEDVYLTFLEQRSMMLVVEAISLINQGLTGPLPAEPTS